MQCDALRSLPGVRPGSRDRATPGDRGKTMIRLGLRLTPQGRLLCEPVADAAGLDEVVATRLGEAFAHGSGDGLLRLGAGEVGQALPPVFVWWRELASRYVAALCVPAARAASGHAPAVVAPRGAAP